jgi:hypothetical protein
VQHLLKLRLHELNRKIADLHLIQRRVAAAIRCGCPPRFKPYGKAVCPTIDRQPIRRNRAVTK